MAAKQKLLWRLMTPWQKFWWSFRYLYWGFQQEDKRTLIWTPLFSLCWYEGAPSARMLSFEYGWRFHLWANIPEPGGYLYRYSWSHIERRYLPSALLHGAK